MMAINNCLLRTDTCGRTSPSHPAVNTATKRYQACPTAAAKRKLLKPHININIQQRLASLVAAGVVAFSGSSLAAEKVGDFPASGFLFKDSVQTLAIDDPEVQGVTIYISDFERNLADKITKFGEEPSSASVTCATTGPIVIKNPKKIRGKSGEDVFSEKKGLGFIKNKTLHVRRIFDEGHKSLLYIAYSTRMIHDDKGESPGRYKTSICALPISSAVTAVERTDTNVDSGLFSQAKSDSR